MRKFYNTVPPSGLVIMAIVAIQLGSALAVHLFPLIGAYGTVATRIVFSAVLLVLLARKRLSGLGAVFRDNWVLLTAFGLSISVMNVCFYLALDRIPLGAAVAIEFVGPLGLAVYSSRRWIQLLWAALAAFGVILLSPVSGNDLDPEGVVFALMAGAGWACFILLAGKLGKRVEGNDSLTIAMLVSSLTMLPFAIPAAGVLFTHPWWLLGGIALALLSTTIPLTLEFQALRRLSTRRYGILISLEPAVAALAGVLILGERLGLPGLIAIACVVVAAIGITLSERETTTA